MADDWGDIETLPPPRSQAPKMLFCACGCLVPLLLLFSVLVWGWRTASHGRDVERQWTELSEVLPNDGQRPEGFRMEFGLQLFGFEWYLFVPVGEAPVGEAPEGEAPEGEAPEGEAPEGEAPEGEAPRSGRPDQLWMLMLQADEVGPMFDPEGSGVEPYQPPGAEEPIRTLRVQGRDLPVALVRGERPAIPWFYDATETDEPSLAVDLTAEGAESRLVLFVAGRGASAVTPEEIQRFLAPFHVGPER